MAGGRPRRRLAACPHSPERVCGGGRLARLRLPPRQAGCVHLDVVAGRRAQQAAGVRQPPAGSCRLVTKVVAPTKGPFEGALRTRFRRKSTGSLHNRHVETSGLLLG